MPPIICSIVFFIPACIFFLYVKFKIPNDPNAGTLYFGCFGWAMFGLFCLYEFG